MIVPAPERVMRAHQMVGPPYTCPWGSFAEFLAARVHAPGLADRLCLAYHDDEQGLHRRYSYAQFGRLVAQAMTVLIEELGLRAGDRLATLLFNHDQAVVLYFAAWAIGVAVVPINREESYEKKRYILEHSEASALCGWYEQRDELEALCDEVPGLRHLVLVAEPGTSLGHGRLLAEALAEARPAPLAPATVPLQTEALIVYTSGTTGPPKGVVLTGENLLVDADGIAAWHGFGPEDRLGCVLPIHHVNGTVVTLVTPCYAGGAAILNRKFRSQTFWRRAEEEGLTCVSVVPTLLEFLLEARDDVVGRRLERFRGVICGAGPLLKETAARFEDRFRVRIRHGYGLSETTCYSCFLPASLSDEEHRRWLTAYEFPSIGLPIRHNEMAILDDQGRSLGEGQRGEICIRGRTVCAGYFKRPDANAAAFCWGWFRSGDEGFWLRDEGGRAFFFISGRLKELIIRGGVNISPLEIDEVLLGHPGVKCGLALPFENRYYGEEIAAYIVPREPGQPPSVAELQAYCRERLPVAKRPKVFVFGQDIPFTATGKPKRLELKSRLASQLAAHRDTQFRE